VLIDQRSDARIHPAPLVEKVYVAMIYVYTLDI